MKEFSFGKYYSSLIAMYDMLFLLRTQNNVAVDVAVLRSENHDEIRRHWMFETKRTAATSLTFRTIFFSPTRCVHVKSRGKKILCMKCGWVYFGFVNRQRWPLVTFCLTRNRKWANICAQFCLTFKLELALGFVTFCGFDPSPTSTYRSAPI